VTSIKQGISPHSRQAGVTSSGLNDGALGPSIVSLKTNKSSSELGLQACGLGCPGPASANSAATGAKHALLGAAPTRENAEAADACPIKLTRDASCPIEMMKSIEVPLPKKHLRCHLLRHLLLLLTQIPRWSLQAPPRQVPPPRVLHWVPLWSELTRQPLLLLRRARLSAWSSSEPNSPIECHTPD
jgi:hypothetical protein